MTPVSHITVHEKFLRFISTHSVALCTWDASSGVVGAERLGCGWVRRRLASGVCGLGYPARLAANFGHHFIL